MRRLISSKSNTCTESADVDVTDISVKVSAQYPGRSAHPCHELPWPEGDGKGEQKSADGIVGQATRPKAGT